MCVLDKNGFSLHVRKDRRGQEISFLSRMINYCVFFNNDKDSIIFDIQIVLTASDGGSFCLPSSEGDLRVSIGIILDTTSGHTTVRRHRESQTQNTVTAECIRDPWGVCHKGSSIRDPALVNQRRRLEQDTRADTFFQ